MHLQIIDDNSDFAITLCEKLINEDTYIKSNEIKLQFTEMQKKVDLDFTHHTPVQISRAVFETYGERLNDNIVFFINVNLLAGGKRQEQKGIELLRWLRLNKCNNHCVLYSFFPLERMVKENPLNSILLSKGVSFVRLPNSFKSINTSELADKSNILPFFRAEVNLLKIRHNLANIYGFYKISKYHNQVDSSFSLKSDLSSSNYDFKLVEFLREDTIPAKVFSVNEDKRISIQETIKEILSCKARVIYLDDQADIGWFIFLKSIIGENLMKIDFDENDTEHTLYDKFNKLQEEQTVDLFICDLRLKSHEEDILDFKELISYKLVKKVRDKNSKQKIMYFSATNDLNKYKSLLGGATGNPDKYKPQYIFTKEGIDQNYSEWQSFQNYYSLINIIKLLLQAEMALKKVQSLFLFDLLKADQIIRIGKEIGKLNGETQYIPKSLFEEFDVVIFDTNAFYLPEKSIKVLQHIHKYSEKALIHYSVYAEMKNFVITQKGRSDKEVQWLLATKCCEYFENSEFPLSVECMSQAELEKAKNFILEKDFADKCLVSLAIDKAKEYETLFVSNDKAYGVRKGRNEADGPIPQLQKWIKSNSNSNLKLSDIDGFLKMKLIDGLSFNNTSIKERQNHHKKHEKLPLSQEISNINQQLRNQQRDSDQLKIYWNECILDESQIILRFKRSNKEFNVTIGKKHRQRFVSAFSRLKLTDNFFVYELKNDSIIGLSKILSDI